MCFFLQQNHLHTIQEALLLPACHTYTTIPFQMLCIWKSGSRPAHYLLIHSKFRFPNVINIHTCHRKLLRALVTHFLHNLYVPKMKECLPFFCIRIRVWIPFCSSPQNPKTNMHRFSNPHFTPEGWRGLTKRSISGQHHGTVMGCYSKSALWELSRDFCSLYRCHFWDVLHTVTWKCCHGKWSLVRLSITWF